MRLDKYLAETAQCTRSEAKTLLQKGRVTVNGAICKKGATQLKDSATVAVDGQPQAEKRPYWKRPASALLTLRPEMSRAEALAIFRKYNSMTQVELGGVWFYVTAIGTGTAPLPCEVQRLSPTRALYRVMDGHLRLHIHPMEVRT